MRLFIALMLPDAFKASIINTQSALKDCGIKGTYTPADNLHITLAFIGEQKSPSKAKDALMQVRFAPFEIASGPLGYFKSSSIIWQGLEDNGNIGILAEKVRSSLKEFGVPFDGKPAMPHITLIRRTSSLPMDKIVTGKETMLVERIDLMRSDHISGRQVYTSLYYRKAES